MRIGNAATLQHSLARSPSLRARSEALQVITGPGQAGVPSQHYLPTDQRITGSPDVRLPHVCYTLRVALGGLECRVWVSAMPPGSSPIMTEWPGRDVLPTAGAEPAADAPLVNSDADAIKSDRRETPRLTAENLAYIHLEPDSGAIVLNVSDGGLCFHAVAPLHQTGVVQFWFSLRADQRIEALGELAWTDQTKKTGGLRFTSLPAGAQEQIRKWVSQSATEPVIRRHSPPPVAAAEAFVPPVLPQPPLQQSDLQPPALQPPALQQTVLQQPAVQQDNQPPVPNLNAAHAASEPITHAPLNDLAIPPLASVPTESLQRMASALADQAPPANQTPPVQRLIQLSRTVPAASQVEDLEPAHIAPAIAEAPRKPRPGQQHPARRRRGARTRFAVGSVAAVFIVFAVVLAGIVLLYPARHRVAGDGAFGGVRDSALPQSNPAAKPVDNQTAPAAPAEARAPDSQNQLAEEIKKLEAEYDDAPYGRTAGQPSTGNARPIHPHQPHQPPHVVNATRRQSQSLRAAAPGITQTPVPHVPTVSSSTGAPAAPEYTAPAEADMPAPSVIVPNSVQPLPSGRQPAPGGLASNSSSPLGRIAGALFGTNPTKPPGSASSSSSEMYFDVGEFKDVGWAERATAQLAQSGFQAQIVHKGRLWLNSYHVLVGPYPSVEAAQRAQAALASRGFKPRPAR
jgi:hypothetical protein